LPFCYFTLSAKRPPSGGYPKSLRTIGDHLRKRRLDLWLTQKEIGARLGVTESAVWNWESGWSRPQFRVYPKIREFLGYELPLPEPATLGHAIKQYRHLSGISQKELAKQIGVDPTTLSRLERGQGRCYASVMRKVTALLVGALRAK
jgi:transcriptional regulator with XRE-family HTH domain